MEHRAGFVNILGNPNVGKSTLMNRLVGEKLSIITSKSQTTRHRIKGIVNGEDFQIVFSDTPGVVKPSYKMQEYMLDFSKSAIIDADIILYVTDVVENIEKNADFIEKVKQSEVPILLVLNKIDLTTPDKLDALFDKRSFRELKYSRSRLPRISTWTIYTREFWSCYPWENLISTKKK